MGSKADKAWRAAATCASLAQQVDDRAEREFYIRMRNAWITVANRCTFLDGLDDLARRGNTIEPLPALEPPVESPVQRR
jgi:hypothetical protein